MQEKLEKILNRAGEIDALLASPEVYSDPSSYAALMREKRSLEPALGAYAKLADAQSRIDGAKELMADRELRELAQEELAQAERDLESARAALEEALNPKDPDGQKSVIVEIRSGVGGGEAALFASDLYRMYSMYAEKKGFGVEVLNANETELGGYRELTFMVEGDGAFARFKYESGIHRVQRVPETESSGRIHTSAVTVAVLPEATEVELEINPSDLMIDTFRSGGAGGQHVNKTESAIRITHIPTGVVVECQDERSQHKNKDKAMKVLRSRLLEAEKEKVEAERAGERREQVGSGDRSGRIRTYNFPQGRVTDHRIGLTLHMIDPMMNGDLDELVEALIREGNK
ncbi:MAG: peptide chain release factor 1 [Clostridia bacterium]|nr:peptide chain release factor 1 [Clostridia bacterium]